MEFADLIVIGSSNMDLVISLPRIPAIGETVLGGKSSMVFGGKGANQAVSAIRSGGNIAFITKVGEDPFGFNMKNHFKTEGLPPHLILSDPEEPTGIAQIFVSEKGENSIAVAPGANMKLLPKDLIDFEDLIINADVILLQLETPMETIEYVADIAFKNNVKVILNPAPAQKLGNELLKKVWILTPNETEASLLTGQQVVDEKSAEKVALQLLDKGVKNVIITMGESGCLLSNENGHKHFSAFKANAVDTTAAGDVFNGTLAVGVTKGKSLDKAILFAAAAAAISVTREGAQPSIPKADEITEFINESNK